MTKKTIEIVNQDGTKSEYIIKKFPPIEGRRIVLGYPITAIASGQDYQANEDIMRKLMAFVSVKIGDAEVSLNTDDLILNHVKDWYSLGCIEIEVLKYNCSFLQNKTDLGSVQEVIVNKFAEYISNAILKAAIATKV